MSTLGGLPEHEPGPTTAARLRDRNMLLIALAVAAGCPILAGDAAKAVAHFAKVARAYAPIDEDRARQARIEAARTLAPVPAVEDLDYVDCTIVEGEARGE